MQQAKPVCRTKICGGRRARLCRISNGFYPPGTSEIHCGSCCNLRAIKPLIASDAQYLIDDCTQITRGTAMMMQNTIVY
jgi:hypothetical protein